MKERRGGPPMSILPSESHVFAVYLTEDVPERDTEREPLMILEASLRHPSHLGKNLLISAMNDEASLKHLSHPRESLLISAMNDEAFKRSTCCSTLMDIYIHGRDGPI
jgi:hypothetical protein